MGPCSSRSTSTLPNLISDGVLRKPPKLPASSSIFARVALERFSTSFSGLKRRILSWTFITGLTDHSKAESHGTYHDFDDIDPGGRPCSTLVLKFNHATMSKNKQPRKQIAGQLRTHAQQQAKIAASRFESGQR